MNTLEMIERLCDIAKQQAEIIKKQAEIIGQYQISEAVEAELEEMIAETDRELEHVINSI